MNQKPELITFDVFGTVLDWRTGMKSACAAAGRPLLPGEFERIIDRQAEIESGCFLTYAEVTRISLIDVLGLAGEAALRIGALVGTWPLFSDAHVLGRLMAIAPCAAMTNSDRMHRAQVQQNLGFNLSDWLCSEDVRVYKPDPRFWEEMAKRRQLDPGSSWWHVSAYADYDLATANGLGLTTVYVERDHSRHGEAMHTVKDLHELHAMVN
jgi:2-haloalkanoic acid dehalogenase type II